MSQKKQLWEESFERCKYFASTQTWRVTIAEHALHCCEFICSCIGDEQLASFDAFDTPPLRRAGSFVFPGGEARPVQGLCHWA